jgi:hypothetical protein
VHPAPGGGRDANDECPFFSGFFVRIDTVRGFTLLGDSAKVAAREFPNNQTHAAETRCQGRGDVRALIG